MTLFFHELRRNRLSFIIWAAAIAFMLMVCVLIYPEMKTQMADMSEMFADMGQFSEAFGMDDLNVGEFMGYFGVECGEVLGLGGALFAAILGISALAKEEKDKTAEFLLTHPVKRVNIASYKLIAVICHIFLLDVCALAVTLLSTSIVGEKFEIKTMMLLFLAYFLMQTVIAGICFGISAFVRAGSVGIGLGVGLIMYFLNLAANMADSLEFVKFITPFSFADGGGIVNNCSLEWKYLITGATMTAVSLVLGFIKYNRKDIV